MIEGQKGPKDRTLGVCIYAACERGMERTDRMDRKIENERSEKVLEGSGTFSRSFHLNI